MSTQLVPLQEKGKSVDLEETIIANNEREAKERYRKAIYLLCRPNTWHAVAGVLSASFAIEGKQENQTIETGDYIRGKIPGPGLSDGDGDDWVHVALIETDFDTSCDESFGILLQVCPNPNHEGEAIAHFFGEGASSSFLIMRRGNTLTAQYKGRNESANTGSSGLADKVRNVVVSAGALAGISELQWNALLKGLLNTEKD